MYLKKCIFFKKFLTIKLFFSFNILVRCTHSDFRIYFILVQNSILKSIAYSFSNKQIRIECIIVRKC